MDDFGPLLKILTAVINNNRQIGEFWSIKKFEGKNYLISRQENIHVLF